MGNGRYILVHYVRHSNRYKPILIVVSLLELKRLRNGRFFSETAVIFLEAKPPPASGSGLKYPLEAGTSIIENPSRHNIF
jgi:hypothetical protein